MPISPLNGRRDFCRRVFLPVSDTEVHIGLFQHFSSDICIGASQTHNKGHVDLDILARLDHAFCDPVTAHNPAKDIDENGLHIGI